MQQCISDFTKQQLKTNATAMFKAICLAANQNHLMKKSLTLSVYIEPNYPITLTTTGDKVSVGAASTTLNVFMTGDTEV